jgi:hypothetical protein
MIARLVPAPDATTPEQEKKARLVRTVKELVGETCRMRNEGVAYAKLAHCQGYADGYMKLLVDSGLLTQSELLEIVIGVRRGVDGPATRTVTSQAVLSV